MNLTPAHPRLKPKGGAPLLDLIPLLRTSIYLGARRRGPATNWVPRSPRSWRRVGIGNTSLLAGQLSTSFRLEVSKRPLKKSYSRKKPTSGAKAQTYFQRLSGTSKLVPYPILLVWLFFQRPPNRQSCGLDFIHQDASGLAVGVSAITAPFPLLGGGNQAASNRVAMDIT